MSDLPEVIDFQDEQWVRIDVVRARDAEIKELRRYIAKNAVLRRAGPITPDDSPAWPQRFRWRRYPEWDWRYGVCFPLYDPERHTEDRWEIRCEGGGVCWFEDDPWEALPLVIGDVVAFAWLDNDYGWCGTPITRPEGTRT